MNVHLLIKTILTGLAVGAILVPTTQVLGSDPAAVSRVQGTARAQKAPEIQDVALDAAGVLHGVFVDRLGLPVGDSDVVVRQGRRVKRVAKTDQTGRFQVPAMRGGVCSVSVGKQTSVLRVWTANAAPPSAKSQLVLVEKVTVVRGQSEDASILTMFDNGTLFMAGAGMAGLTLGVVGVSEASEANDEAASLRQQLNDLSTTVDGILATLN